MTTRTQATLEDLYRIPEGGKAELVNGEIVRMAPTGFLPSYAAGEIFSSLRDFARRSGSGIAMGDNAGFVVDLPNRESFSPNASWHSGPPTGMKFLQGAPVFAVEVRSEGDYGDLAERRLAEKRRDYFEAGTLCVWDVDLLGGEVIRAYHVADPSTATVFKRGDRADAGKALPGWSFKVDDLFPEP